MKNASFGSAYSGSLVAMEIIGLTDRKARRQLFEVIPFSIQAAMQKRESKSRRLNRRRLKPSGN